MQKQDILRCPKCAKMNRNPLFSPGDTFRCECGQLLRVPGRGVVLQPEHRPSASAQSFAKRVSKWLSLLSRGKPCALEQNTSSFHPSIERDLDRLAAVAWRLRGAPKNMQFLLGPRSLPAATNIQSIEKAIGLLYEHARKWAAGFNVPFSVPRVRLPFVNIDPAPGLYRVDQDGYVSIEISPALLKHPDSVLAVLAHEACHHILDLSGMNTRQPKIDEPLTDLAMFICGFGKVFMDGRSYLTSNDNRWCSTHLGYLTDEQYKFAYRWVIQSASGTKSEVTAGQQIGYDVRYYRTKLLNKLGGNASALERLLERERQRQPGCDESTLYISISEQIEWDSR
jgi:hypothetical protein